MRRRRWWWPRWFPKVLRPGTTWAVSGTGDMPILMITWWPDGMIECATPSHVAMEYPEILDRLDRFAEQLAERMVSGS